MEFSIYAEFENAGHGVSYFEINRTEFSAWRIKRDVLFVGAWCDERYHAGDFKGYWLRVGQGFYPLYIDNYDVLVKANTEKEISDAIEETLKDVDYSSPLEFEDAFVVKFEDR